MTNSPRRLRRTIPHFYNSPKSMKNSNHTLMRKIPTRMTIEVKMKKHKARAFKTTPILVIILENAASLKGDEILSSRRTRKVIKKNIHCWKSSERKCIEGTNFCKRLDNVKCPSKYFFFSFTNYMGFPF